MKKNNIKVKSSNPYSNQNKKIWIGLIIGLVILALVLPYYVYLIAYKDVGFDLTDKGSIGDAIGGITAPIIGILGAVLVYLSFTSQVSANNLIIKHNEFRLIIDLINELNQDINYLYDRKNWDIDTTISHNANSYPNRDDSNFIKTPYLKELNSGEYKFLPAVFKRKLMYVFNSYISINEMLINPIKLNEDDRKSIINSLNNIYDCYLVNYCLGYEKLDLSSKVGVELSRKIQVLAENIIKMNKIRLNQLLEDDD